MTLLDQQCAARWHQEQADAAHRARLVRALRRQARATARSQRCDEQAHRAIAAVGLLPW